jgi:raffinose/stachyose/melibiose transport system substrate-binding protein
MAALATAAAVPLFLAGCSTGADPDAPAGGDLTYWVGLETIDDASIAAVQKLYVDPFEATHPDIHIKVVPINEEGAGAKVQTALAAGQGPDFIETPGSSTAIPYAQAGYLADLGPLAEEEGWKDTMLPWALDMGVIDGKLVAIPVTYETLVLYYNKTLFAEHGWQPPTDQASLETLAGEMVDAGVTPFTAGNADYVGATEFLISAFLNEVAGPGNVHDALAGKRPFTDQPFVDAIQRLVDYFDAGWFAGGAKQYFAASDTQKMSKIANGDAGMLISGSWDIATMNEYFGESGQDWGWVALPSLADGVPGDVYPLSVGGTISINSATKNLPAAEEYLKWKFSDTDANWAAISEVGDLPLPVAFDATTVPEGIDPRFVEQYTAISAASEAGQVGYVTWTSFGGGAEAYILENEDRLLTHALSPQEFLKGVDAAFQQDKADGVIPPLFDTKAR